MARRRDTLKRPGIDNRGAEHLTRRGMIRMGVGQEDPVEPAAALGLRTDGRDMPLVRRPGIDYVGGVLVD